VRRPYLVMHEGRSAAKLSAISSGEHHGCNRCRQANSEKHVKKDLGPSYPDPGCRCGRRLIDPRISVGHIANRQSDRVCWSVLWVKARDHYGGSIWSDRIWFGLARVIFVTFLVPYECLALGRP